MTLTEELIALRRGLHGNPEIGLDLPRTQEAVLEALDPLDLEVGVGKGLSSVTAVLRGARPGPTVLLRGDMDALPITENTGLPFASTNGAMHACGHDLHVAGLVGAARLLAARRTELAGSVVFMFQPGEEGFAGGRTMIDEGVLDVTGGRPVAAYAVHVDCQTPSRSVVTRQGPIMAGVSVLRIRVSGTGGHAAHPHHAVDPVPVAAEIVLAVQAFVARRVPVADPAVVSITRISSDSAAGNVLATNVDLEANVRTLSRETLALVRLELLRLVTALGEAHGCGVTTDFVDSYPVTVNDPAETAHVLEFLDERHGDAVVRMPSPAMASEDFAYVLDQVPGTLVFLGVAPAEPSGPMHSEHAVFDDSLLGEHATLLADLARRRLARALLG
ncbi:M20 family metallopeptidase [Kineococcus sp. GCM10028916]|uniref:M20 metallopeptidase family protein n=1 Tax=Kineococcus sp. GCM10028916 TaxID=3273394 RepID=UPI003634B0E0